VSAARHIKRVLPARVTMTCCLQLTAALSEADSALDGARAQWAALTPVLDAVREGPSAPVRPQPTPFCSCSTCDSVIPVRNLGSFTALFRSHRSLLHTAIVACVRRSGKPAMRRSCRRCGSLQPSARCKLPCSAWSDQTPRPEAQLTPNQHQTQTSMHRTLHVDTTRVFAAHVFINVAQGAADI